MACGSESASVLPRGSAPLPSWAGASLAPLRDRQHCYWHDPEHAQSATEARRLGGQRRKREGTLTGAYEFEGLRGPEDLKRILEIATYDALALDNSVARARVLIAVVQAGTRLFEITDLELRLEAIEALMEPRGKTQGRGRR